VLRAADLTRTQIVQTARNAFTIAWPPGADRARYLAGLAAYDAER